MLDFCEVEITSETGTHFLCLCPFHGNFNSAAMAVDKEKGLWTCFNPSCGQRGKLEDLPTRLKGQNIFQAKRIILKYANAANRPVTERIAEIYSEKQEFPDFSLDKIDSMHNAFWGSKAHDYMKDRGFEDETLEHFKVGYSPKKNLVCVPMYEKADRAVGVIGRSLPPEQKRFRNSDNLPKKELPWNLQNAKLQGDTVIIVEASFDGMRIHQAGYPNVIALLGGHLSPWHIDLINKHFSKIIIMSDYDQLRFEINCAKCKKLGHRICVGHNDGRELGRQIVGAFPTKRVMWAAYDDKVVYPHNAKDASDMTDNEIRQCLRNSISNFEYVRWNPEKLSA